MNKRARAMVNYLISIVIALLLAFAIIGALLLWQGVDPVETFLALFQGAFIGKSNLGASLLLATPLILGGLGGHLAGRQPGGPSLLAAHPHLFSGQYDFWRAVGSDPRLFEDLQGV